MPFRYKRFLKHNLKFLAKPLIPLLNAFVFKIRSGPAKGMYRKGGLIMALPSAPDTEDIFLDELELNGKVIYDIGANIGIMSLFFARAAGSEGKVLAFEPNPDTFPLLQDNIAVNKLTNVKLFNIGVGDHNSRENLVVHKGGRGRGSMDENIVRSFEEKGNNKVYSVEVHALDTFVPEHGLPNPDFVKIDTEGFEYQCLLGMQDLIDTYHPDSTSRYTDPRRIVIH